MAKRLTDKQRLWLEAYLETRNATEAARRAGYQGNDNTLASIGSENLRKPKLRAAIDKRVSERAMSANEVLDRLREEAVINIGDFLVQVGQSSFVLDMDEVRARGHLIKKIKYTKHGPEIELHDAQSALKMLGRYHALFTDRIEVEDWRTEIIQLLREGVLSPDEVKEELGSDLARDLFESAGVPVTADREAQA